MSRRAAPEVTSGQVSRRTIGVVLTAAAGFAGAADLRTRGTRTNSPAAITVRYELTSSVTGPAYIDWLSPSNDTTGATDAATINSALASNIVVVLGPGHWYIDAPIILPSCGNRARGHSSGNRTWTGADIRLIGGRRRLRRAARWLAGTRIHGVGVDRLWHLCQWRRRHDLGTGPRLSAGSPMAGSSIAWPTAS